MGQALIPIKLDTFEVIPCVAVSLIYNLLVNGVAMLRAFLTSAMLLAVLACQGSFAAEAGSKKAAHKPPADPPMRVVLVRSTEQGCEPICTEWIYAEGKITPASAQEFRRAFKKAGKLRLPIVINSFGGDVSAAISIGRLIRERKAVVMVGQSMFYGCQPMDKKCKPDKAKRERYSGSYVIFPGYCLSACGLVLAGGSSRFSEPGRIGTHQILQTGGYERVWYRETYRIVKGKKKIISRKITKRQKITLKPTTNVRASTRRKINDYLASMGIDLKYAELFEKAPPTGMYMLNEDEMRQTHIAQRPMVPASMMRKSLCENLPAPHCIKLDPAVP